MICKRCIGAGWLYRPALGKKHKDRMKKCTDCAGTGY